MNSTHTVYLLIALCALILVLHFDLSLSWFMRKLLGQEVVTYIKSLCNATDPNSAIAVGFLFFIAILGFMGVVAMRIPELRSSGAFWGSWMGAVGSVFAAKWLGGRDNNFKP